MDFSGDLKKPYEPDFLPMIIWMIGEKFMDILGHNGKI